MTRRCLLTVIELAAVATALGASLPILAHAADYHASWAGPALLGAVVAGSILAIVTPSLLNVGIWQWRQRLREQADVPPSAHTPLWAAPDAPEVQEWDRAHPGPDPEAYEAVRRARYAPAADEQHAAAMAAVAAGPMQPQTVGYTAVIPTVTGPSFGFSPHGAGVVEPERAPWTAPMSATAGRHAGAEGLVGFDRPAGGVR